MSELFYSPFFGVALSIFTFWVGVRIQKKTGLVVCNPLLIGVVLTIGVLLLFRIPYEAYDQGAEFISLFLSPATACLAVAIYGKLPLLRRNWLPILVGCTVGSVVSMGSVLLLCRLFGLDEAMTASLLPKSVTTPIAISVSEHFSALSPYTLEKTDDGYFVTWSGGRAPISFFPRLPETGTVVDKLAKYHSRDCITLWPSSKLFS